jgi:hypothetical protein
MEPILVEVFFKSKTNAEFIKATAITLEKWGKVDMVPEIYVFPLSPFSPFPHFHLSN